MSRARKIKYNDQEIWFDTRKNSNKPKAEQLELLAVVLDVDIDDLLDEHVTQGEVLERLRDALGHNVVPHDILLKRQRLRVERQSQPQCRICGKIGDSTKHHFINKWILKELSNYTSKWADRSKNCIPICIDCHRDLHMRDNGPVSIVEYLNDAQKAFAEAALSALAEERPKLLILLARGDRSVYESQLVKDWMDGRFRVDEGEYSVLSSRQVA